MLCSRTGTCLYNCFTMYSHGVSLFQWCKVHEAEWVAVFLVQLSTVQHNTTIIKCGCGVSHNMLFYLNMVFLANRSVYVENTMGILAMICIACMYTSCSLLVHTMKLI